MRTLGTLAMAAAMLDVLACNSGSGKQVTSPPPVVAIGDTLNIADPTHSLTPGGLHFTLTRSSSSTLPAASTDALIRVSNPGSGFDNITRVTLPAPGTSTPVSVRVPADSGYIVSVIAFHGATFDAGGSTSNPDSSITVLPQGGPQPAPATQVTVAMGVPSGGYNLQDGAHITAGESEPIIGFVAMAPRVFDGASCTWGCALAGDWVSTYDGSYLNVVPNTPGPWTVAATFIADWGGYGLTFTSDSLHLIIDPGTGGIDVSFRKVLAR
jgi:hypothetical protein